MRDSSELRPVEAARSRMDSVSPEDSSHWRSSGFRFCERRVSKQALVAIRPSQLGSERACSPRNFGSSTNAFANAIWMISSGTDSPFRETSDIRDGSRFTADMAVQNVIGDAMRGATWVSLHNGGGVGWGEVINGGFGLVLDGTAAASEKLNNMLFWDVNNGIARRSWARNEGAVSAIQRAMAAHPTLKVTLPNLADDDLIRNLSF